MDPQLQQHYEVRARQAVRWHDHGRTFICAGNRLVDWYVQKLAAGPSTDPERRNASFQPIFLLFGVAAENLLKCLLIVQGEDPVSNGVLKKSFKTHNLESLAQRAGLTLSGSESELLRRLRDFIESSKYPIGTEAGKGQGGNRFEYPRDLDNTWALLQKLDDALQVARQPSLQAVDVKVLCRQPTDS